MGYVVSKDENPEEIEFEIRRKSIILFDDVDDYDEGVEVSKEFLLKFMGLVAKYPEWHKKIFID